MGGWENHPNVDEIIQSQCSHDWKNDEMFENGVVEMFTSMQGEEMRQFCSKCGKVQYITKDRNCSS